MSVNDAHLQTFSFALLFFKQKFNIILQYHFSTCLTSGSLNHFYEIFMDARIFVQLWME